MQWNEGVQSTEKEASEPQYHAPNRYPQSRKKIIKISVLLCKFVCLFFPYIVYSLLSQLKKNIGLINTKTKANTF